MCGTDTLKISLDNYHFGPVDWQESADNENWLDIENEHDTVLVYYTTEEKYIRGCITTSDCGQVYSNPVFIRQIPQANAGRDVDVMTGIILKGNRIPGATGEWKLLDGLDAELTDPDSAQSGFYNSAFLEGALDSSYHVLMWSLSNQCGSTNDTMVVNFSMISYNPNHILVDSTDQIIFIEETDSDTVTYTIQFSDMTYVDINDGVILINYYHGEGFLRMVESWETMENSTVKFTTIPCALDTLVTDGALSLDDDALAYLDDDHKKSSAGSFILDHLPTRNELKSDPRYKKGAYIYHYPDEFTESPLVKSINTESSGLGFSLGNSETITEDGDTLIVEMTGSIDFNPNFIFRYRVKRFKLRSLTAGMENATLNTAIGLNLHAVYSKDESIAYNKDFSKKKKKEIAKKTSRKVVIAGGVPILVLNKLSCTFSVEPHIEAELNASYDWSRSSSFSAYMIYIRGQALKSVCNKGDTFTDSHYEVNFSGSAGVDLTLETSVDMMIYGIIGPYLSVPLTLKPEICASLEATGGNSNQNAAQNEDTLHFSYGFNVPLSIDAKVGCKVKLFRKTLFNRSITVNLYKNGFYYPYSVDLFSGNNQIAYSGESLAVPLTVNVQNNWGGGAPLIPVFFSVVDGNGVLEDTILFSDFDGLAENNITIGSDDYNRIKVQVFDCDLNPIKGAEDLYFEVNTECKNSSLQLAFNFLEDKTVQPVGVMGKEPYKYSMDDIIYAEDISYPDIFDMIGKSIYVQDSAGCKASKTVRAIDTCNYSGLSVSVIMEGTSAVAEGLSGTPPYQYSMYENGPFSEENEFFVGPGSYEIFIEDSSGCTSSQKLFIEDDLNDGLVAYYPFNGNANDESGNLHHAIVEGAVLSADRFGSENNAYLIEGNSIMTVPSDEDFIMKGDFSISLWTYTDLEYDEVSPSHFPLSVGIPGIDTVGLNLVYITESYSLGQWLYTDDFSARVGKTQAYNSEGHWHQYIIVREMDSIKFYRDGGIFLGKLYEPRELFRSCDFHFGNTFDGNHALNGIIDEIRIYNRAISLTEINDLYHQIGIDGILTDPFIDTRDSIAYNQVRIGKQVWMNENLKWLPEVSPPEIRTNESTLYYVYDYIGTDVDAAKNTDNYNLYGVLYNFKAAMNACPDGWHLATYDEWVELAEYASYPSNSNVWPDAGFHLKADFGWPDGRNGSDGFHFSALPGGQNHRLSGFIQKDALTNWICKGTESQFYVWRIYDQLMWSSWASHYGDCGLSVRCIKDEALNETEE